MLTCGQIKNSQPFPCLGHRLAQTNAICQGAAAASTAEGISKSLDVTWRRLGGTEQQHSRAEHNPAEQSIAQLSTHSSA